MSKPIEQHRLLSISKILAPYAKQLTGSLNIDESPNARGQAVHAAGASLLLGQRPFIAGIYAGYLDSLERWLSGCVAEVLEVEKQFNDYNRLICGIPDAVVRLNSRQIAVVDLKSGSAEKTFWRLQLAAYRYLVCIAGYEVNCHQALMLLPDGGFPVVLDYSDDYKNHLRHFFYAYHLCKLFS